MSVAWPASRRQLAPVARGTALRHTAARARLLKRGYRKVNRWGVLLVGWALAAGCAGKSEGTNQDPSGAGGTGGGVSGGPAAGSSSAGDASARAGAATNASGSGGQNAAGQSGAVAGGSGGAVSSGGGPVGGGGAVSFGGSSVGGAVSFGGSSVGGAVSFGGSSVGGAVSFGGGMSGGGPCEMAGCGDSSKYCRWVRLNGALQVDQCQSFPTSCRTCACAKADFAKLVSDHAYPCQISDCSSPTGSVADDQTSDSLVLACMGA